MADLGAGWICIYSQAYMVVMFQKFQHRSSFAQVAIEYTCGEIYKYIQGSPVEIQAPWNGNLISRTMTALVCVLSPSIILPSLSCVQIPARWIFACLKNVILLHTPENVLFWTCMEYRSVFLELVSFCTALIKGNSCRIWNEIVATLPITVEYQYNEILGTSEISLL